MFEENFKQALYALFLLNPDPGAVRSAVSNWKLETCRGWGRNALEQQYFQTAAVKDLTKQLSDCRGKLKEFLAEIKGRFAQIFGNGSIQILTDAREIKPTYIGEQALDALARLLLAKFDKEVCVCVCIHPLYHTLVVTSNNCGLDAQEVAAELQEIARLAAHEIQQLEDEGKTRDDLLSALKPKWNTRDAKKPPKADYDARLQLDRIKYFQQFVNLAKLPIRTPKYPGTHADVQLLEYIEVSMRGNPSGGTMYLGDAMRCCAKCETLIRLYNACGFNKVKVARRGYHPGYDIKGWRCLPALRDVITHSGNAASRAEALDLLTVYEQASKISMHADLSDDDS